MTTRVDFYIVSANNENEKLEFVCRLLEKAYKQRHQIFVLCKDQTQTHALDELLWTFKDISFLPHNILGEGPEPPPPIQLGDTVIPNKHRDILITLKHYQLEQPNKYRRIIEVIANNEADKENARINYRRYREINCQLHSHDLTK
ncbi:MAG: DNA polymerase III subunit chi [Legionellales bacterium]|nr:DNA polymerase III subunit chi [Legionellales bacterium]|tara:strand:- start:263 stop:697 length:435 start_codon:yes stop_codon:yes gene_type:complete